MQSNIKKLYVSNFLVGLVFWYGIEKLFMQGIGIDAVGVGITIAVLLGFNLVFDIPSGVLADRWSRKGMLFVAVTAMAICSVILGTSHSLTPYLIGYLFYGVYVVSTSGTYQAIMYDSLHEVGRAKQYSKIMGRAYALFLAGSGVANVLSGFISHTFSYQTVFFLSVIPCVLNILVIASLREPKFHKAEQKEKMFAQIKDASKTIANISLLRSLAIIMSALTIVELFKGEFGQLYMLRYMSAPQVLGLLWAAYAFTWSLGSLLAHKFHARLNTLVIATVLPLVAMSFIDNWFSLVLFMVQATAAAALLNQIETRIQDATPSAVRASILSVLSSIGRAISIPASFAIGWLIREYNAYWALRGVTIVAVIVLLYWLWVSRKESQANKPIAAETVPVS
jgi:predicted MFS family arabinose efflux permease